MNRHLSYTIYASQGNNRHPDGCVGITFQPTPSLTASEVFAIADALIAIAKEMREEAKS